MSAIDDFLNDKPAASTNAIDGFLADAPPKASGFMRRAADTGLSLAKGVIGVPEAAVGVADLVTGGQAGKLVESAGVRFKDAKGMLDEMYSPEQKAANEEVNQTKGFFPTIGAMARNPSTILNQAVESAPSMLVGGVASRGLLAAAPRIGAVAAGAAGEGLTAAGQNAEQVRQEDPNGTLTGEQSAILAASGLLTGGISLASGKLANKLGIGDVQTMLAAGKTGAVGEQAIAAGAKKGMARKVAEGVGVEGVLQELPQSYQEQVGQNLAQGKPWDEGAAEAGAQGMMAGGLMGSIAGPLGGHEAKASPAPTQEPVAPAEPEGNPAPSAPPGLGFNPNAGTHTVFPDGSVILNSDSAAGEQAVFDKRFAPQPADPVRAAVQQAADAGGALSAAAVVAIDSGAHANEVTKQSALQPAPGASNVSAGTEVSDVAPVAAGRGRDNAAPGVEPAVDSGNQPLGAAAAVAGRTAGAAAPVLPTAQPAAPDLQAKLDQVNREITSGADEATGARLTPFQMGMRKAQANHFMSQMGANASPAAAPTTPDVSVPNQATAQAASAQSAIESGAPAADMAKPAGPMQLGRNNQPLSEGGKPFATGKAAAEAKKLQPMMRVVPVEGGFALADKTPKQLAAEAKAAKRLRNPQTSAPGQPIPAHAFIASEGGLHADTRADMVMEGNVRVGNRSLFAGQGKGLNIERATMRLVEEGYLPESASHDDTRNLIKRSLKNPQYTPEGFERMAEAESAAQFDDYVRAEQDAPTPIDDNFDPFMLDDAELAEMHSEATAATQREQDEFNALVAAAEAAGIDTETILLDAHDETTNGTLDDYRQNAANRIEQAQAIRSQAPEGARTEQGRPAAEPESLADGRQVPGAESEQGAAGRVAEAAQASTAPAEPPDTLATVLAKQLPDMTDGELQQAKAHYPADHKRAPKVTKEINRRALVAKLKPAKEAPASVPTEQAPAKSEVPAVSPDRPARTDSIGSAAGKSSLDAYLADEPGDQEALNVSIQFRQPDGSTLRGARNTHIENAINDGYSVVLTKSGPALVNNKMQGWNAADLGAAGMRYANWLSSPSPSTNEGLTVPTEQDVLAQQERAEAATKTEKAQQRAADERERRERERKDIAKASEAAADSFVLGGDAEQNLSGQGGIFDGATAPSAIDTAAEPVAGLYTGTSDPSNSAPMQELDGFKVGELVDVPSRTIGRSTVELLFTSRTMVSSEPYPMARIKSAKGKLLDIGTDGLIKVNVPAADKTKASTEAKAEKPAAAQPDQFAGNKLFTADKVAAARERMTKKLGTLNSGLDPELMMDGMTIAGAYIESGVRSFAAYAKAMVEDMGEGVKPYLLSFWEASRHFPGLDTAGMTSADESARLHSALLTTEATAPTGQTLTQSLAAAIESGNMPKDNPALKKLVEAFDGQPADPARMKQAQEELETAIAMIARKVVAKREGDRSTFDALLRLYESQPNLNIRTSTSIANQAYSTPAPLAYLASRLAGITSSTVAHEPTAGTGMLLIGADPKKAIVNELNDLRIDTLKSQGFAPTQKDAATQLLVPEGVQPDAIVTNPPFGSVKDAEGKPVKVKVDGYSMGQIDHLIAARALQAMKEDGRATLILGANKVAGGLSTDDRIFFNWLYSHYNVAGHFEVEGDLYTRQGAGWPVRVITINGRQASSQLSPVAGTIQRADNWSQVYEQFTQSLASANERPALVGQGAGPAAAVPAPSPTGQGRPRGSAGSTGNVAGTSPRAVPDRAEPAAEPVGRSPDEQRLNAQPYVPQPQPGQNPAGARQPAKPAGTAALDEGQAPEGNAFQTPYTPRSARKDEGVLIPANMAQPLQDSLSRLEDEVGDIDEFARKELGYDTVQDLHNALMGLQVDSVAMAIHQIKQGKALIISDQTGIGKGRQAASIIRWAARQGMTPVFVSVKPSLFTDMYGDLADIGTHDVTPFIMNGDAWVAGDDGGKLFANKPSGHKATIQAIAESGTLPEGSNALFMTYSQINVANVQRQALMALAPNAVFVLDESHNAAGASATGNFMIDALGLSKGVTYLSATYAKRPDNMPLYFKTDIGDAAADATGLADAMTSGGLPLQTVVSNNLVKAGQMFRRERSYDGVSIASTFDTPHRELHERMSNEATKALRAIVSADRMFHSVYVKELAKELEKNGATIQDSAGNQVEAGVQHTEFSSVVHNFVKQMLLGLKAQTAANEAIASLKRGEKPIIAVENTMGSFLNEYAAANGIAQGDSLGAFDYRTVLTRALARSRVVIESSAMGDKTKRPVSLGELDAQTRAAYEAAQDVIDGLTLDIPVSPIDWMRAEISRAGFTVAEITGRSLAVDYSNAKKPELSAIDLTEQKDKVNTTRQFNSGKLDALILNVAGSTGISLHASEKFEDQRQRHMIVAQAAGDINIFMQMLGRVHRTGQVRLPKYTILSVDLPTEKRPTAVLSVKMKSLNANTSSNTESATSVKSSDILNKYGDQIVAQYLNDNYALARELDLEQEIGGDPQEDIARKATGRLALQPIDVQHTFYDEVEAQYTALIDYLNKTNQNDLEPRTFDFDAKETRQEVLFEGPNKATPFGEDAIYGEYSIKAQGSPMKPEEIRATMAENLDGLNAAAHTQRLLADLDEKFKAYHATLEDAGKESAAGVRGTGYRFLMDHPIGSTFRVDINSEPFNAVVLNVRNSHKTTGNPYSLSKIQLTVAVNGALRSLSVPATQFSKIEVSSIAPTFRVEQLFKEQPPNQRETAKIVTGNLLAAYGELKGVRGTIITFTKQDGTSEQGILLPKLFDYSKNTQGDYRLASGAAALQFLQKSNDRDIGRFGIMSRDSVVRVLPAGQGIRVQVPKSKLKGGKFFLDAGLIEAGGDFTSSGGFMAQVVYEPQAAIKVLDLLMKKQALYALPSMADEAKALTGGMAAPAFSRTPSRSGLPPAQVQSIVDAIAARWANAPSIVVAQSMDDPVIPARVRGYNDQQKSLGATGEPDGFVYGGKVYVLASQLATPSDVMRVLLHEIAGHAGLRGAFGDSLNPMLNQVVLARRAEVSAKAAQYGLDMRKAEDRLTAAEEVLAELAEQNPQLGIVQRAIAAIRTWLRAHVPGFDQMALTDDEIVRSFLIPARRFVEGKAKTSQSPAMQGAPMFSRSQAMGDALKAITVTDLKAKAGNRLSDYRNLGLQFLGGRQINDLYGKDIPQLPEYTRMVQQMSADANEVGANADAVATAWGKLKDERQLAELMHDATLAQIDPDQPAPVTPATKGREAFAGLHAASEHRKLKARFDALSPEAQKVYRDAREGYKAHFAAVRTAIREKIERSAMNSAAKKAMLERMDAEFFGHIKGVYFPLARFGKYVVLTRNAAGEVVNVSRAETMNEAEALRGAMRKAYPGHSVGKVLKDKEFNAARDSVGRGFLKDLFGVLDKEGVGEELQDAVNQLYLSSMPDLSWAKHGLHRKGTPGFSQDARRAYAQNMFHGARYLAKLRYADQLQDRLNDMQGHVEAQADNEGFDSVKGQQVVDEVVKRHDSLMNPKSNPLSTALTSFGFVFHLGLSPASALVNLSQTALVAYPIMGAKWGFDKAAAALAVAGKQAAANKNDISSALNADERRAYEVAVNAGTIDVTNAHDLAGISQGEDSGVMWKIRPVMKWASFMFHHAERFNRQVTFVASYRLARAAGTAHEAAIEQATKATYDGHFDYASSNRPRIMQGNVAKVLLLFRQFGQNSIYLFARQAQQAIKAETPEGRKEARKALSGLLVMHAAGAGVLGLPLVTTLLAAASMIGGSDDEPWDAEVALRNMLADTFGQKPAEVMARGLSRLTPWDISSRVGLDKLILPDVQEGLEGQRLAESAMTAALGPVAGIGVNALKGMQEIAHGEYARGLESMMPAALRGPMKALRYGQEGARDKTGIVIKDEVGAGGLLGQTLGFSPSEVRSATEGRSAIYAADSRLGRRRAALLEQFAHAYMKHDDEAMAQARTEIDGFNEKNPQRRINNVQLMHSVHGRQRRIDQAKEGIYLPKKRQDMREAGRFAVAE